MIDKYLIPVVIVFALFSVAFAMSGEFVFAFLAGLTAIFLTAFDLLT